MTRHQQAQVHSRARRSPSSFPFGEEVSPELVATARLSGLTGATDPSISAMRIDFGGKPVVLSVIHPGGSNSASQSLLMDIGMGGASVLYPGFLHTGTDCALWIEAPTGEEEMVRASVASCYVLAKGIHIVNLRWAEAVDLRALVPSTHWSALEPPSVGRQEPALSGKLLTIGVPELEVELIRMLTGTLNIEITEAPFAGAALDSLHEHAFDILERNGDCPETDYAGFVPRLRAEGFVEPIFVLVDRRHMPAASSDPTVRHVARPINADDFTATIQEALRRLESNAGGSKPIVSERADEPQAEAGISTFVKQARGLRDRLRSTINSDNADQARECLELLHNTAPGFGFPIVCEVAHAALTALNASGSAEESGPAIKQLIRVLDRIQDPAAGAEAA